MITLMDWQKDSSVRLEGILRSGPLAMDFSDVGSGKTFVAVDALVKLGRPVLVICPKVVVSNWHTVFKLSGYHHLLLGVINWEKIQTGSTAWFRDNRWNLPEGAILVVDEVHRGCSGPDTQTTKMLALTRAYRIPVLALSATPADSPLKLRALGYLAGLHGFNKSSFYDWCARNGCKRNPWNGFTFPKGPKGQEIMRQIHAKLSDRMTRIRVEDIPGFPECDTEVQLFDLAPADREAVNQAFAEMVERCSKPNSNPMIEILRARQIAELHKVPLLARLVRETIEDGHSAAVFVNFRDTMEALRVELEASGIYSGLVHGVQGQKEQEARDEAIARFQANRDHVILVMSQAGGVGVSLHDLNGRPRRAFITPSYNAVEFKQVLGRIHRAGSKSKAVQTIVLAADTVEENVYGAIVGKMKNLDAIVDGDLELVEGLK